MTARGPRAVVTPLKWDGCITAAENRPRSAAPGGKFAPRVCESAPLSVRNSGGEVAAASGKLLIRNTSVASPARLSSIHAIEIQHMGGGLLAPLPDRGGIRRGTPARRRR